MDAKRQVKVDWVYETTHRSHPGWIRFVLVLKLAKKKGFMDEYGHKIFIFIITAASLCRTALSRAEINPS